MKLLVLAIMCMCSCRGPEAVPDNVNELATAGLPCDHFTQWTDQENGIVCYICKTYNNHGVGIGLSCLELNSIKPEVKKQ